MKSLPDSPPPPHAFRSSLRNRNYRSFEIEIFSESPRTVNSMSGCAAEEGCVDNDLPRQRASLRSSSYGDEGYGHEKTVCSEKFYSSHQFQASKYLKDDDDDDDDDGMQWANSPGLQTALQSFCSGDGKGFYAAKMASGKENKVRIPCKLASFPSSINLRQHAGPIKPNSGPFSGPLKVTAKLNSAVKANMAPSIIPVNPMCKKMLGFDVCEPMSPEVTCLGRIKIKEPHDKVVPATTASTPGAVSQKVEKGRCFDTKNQLCGKRAKGRKKKKIAEKSRCLSRKRRFASKEAADSQSFSSHVSLEIGETRREKAASLARSLTDLLEDVRRFQKDKANYVPSVPPPNSLLLMRGSRIRDESCSPSMQNVDEATSNGVHISLKVEALAEKGCCEANVKNLRNTATLRLSLLDLIDMEDEEFSISEIEDTMTRQRTSHPRALRTFLCERENFEAVENDGKKNKSTVEGLSWMQSPRVAIWQRRGFSELTPILVEQHTKQKRKQCINRWQP